MAVSLPIAQERPMPIACLLMSCRRDTMQLLQALEIRSVHTRCQTSDSPDSRLESQHVLRKLTTFARWPASRQAGALCRAAALARTSDVARQAK